MPHRDVPLSVGGRHRLVERCRARPLARPLAHVAAGMDVTAARMPAEGATAPSRRLRPDTELVEGGSTAPPRELSTPCT